MWHLKSPSPLLSCCLDEWFVWSWLMQTESLLLYETQTMFALMFVETPQSVLQGRWYPSLEWLTVHTSFDGLMSCWKCWHKCGKHHCLMSNIATLSLHNFEFQTSSQVSLCEDAILMAAIHTTKLSHAVLMSARCLPGRKRKHVQLCVMKTTIAGFSYFSWRKRLGIAKLAKCVVQAFSRFRCSDTLEAISAALVDSGGWGTCWATRSNTIITCMAGRSWAER